MNIPFTKMHGIGNDFIVVDCRTSLLHDPKAFAIKYCDRRFGIGADQLLLLYPSAVGDFKMLIFNADGSEVEMCGNGIRCFAKYIWDRKISDKAVLDVETLAGIIRPERAGDMVKVDMGEPILEPARIPVNLQGPGPIIDYPVEAMGRIFNVTFVSMGNPHAVIFLDENVTEFPVDTYGPLIENHALFPKRINVEFVNKKSDTELVMRVWERGSGITLACGTGATATGIAAMVKKLTRKRVTVHLLGGDLDIEWADNGHAYMTGPAEEVFEGAIPCQPEARK
ncbi:MAG TPA: diaminopimelate epimerase [Dissulfurispiraceae bacterium]|nr:diaminopimelate epimerase [Dissulfurispiraceae bacterium]